MFSGHFYHSRVKKAVAIFGAMFNELYIVRSGPSQSYNQIRVPLQYAPSRKFMERIEQMTNGEDAERQLATKLPRMSFEIPNNFQYDAQRQLPKMNTIKRPIAGQPNRAAKIYTGTPYNIPFQLFIYAKTHDDALQVVEQILPYFAPQYNVSVKLIEGIDNFTEDVPITITGVSFSDDYEGLVEQRRTIIYTLDFEMKINFYGPQPSAEDMNKVIKRVDVDYFSLDFRLFDSDSSDSDGYVFTSRTEVNPFDASKDSDWTVREFNYDKFTDSV